MDINIKLNKPHAGQQQVLKSNAKFKILMCGRRWGKSLIAQQICIRKMLLKESIAYVTPTFDLSKEFYNQILNKLPAQIIKSENKSDLSIELITGGKIKFFSGESLSRFRGYKFHYLIIDEAAYIPNLLTAWGEDILPTLIDYNGGGLIISTPRGKEFFYSLYQKGINKDEGFESFHYTTYHNPYLSQQAIQELESSLTQSQINQELRAEAGENSNNPFGIDNIKKNIIFELSTEPTIIYGIDLAKYNDWTVIIGLDINGYITYYDRFRLDWVSTQDRISKLPSDINKVVDSTGVGDVVLDNLYQTCSNISGFKFTTESKPKIIYELIKNVENGNVKYNQQTADEMYVFEYKYNSNGHIKFEAQSGYNDDSICALAIANHHKGMAIHANEWKPYFV